MKLKTKWLFFFSLLITPIVAEMVINAQNLPTPWPIALITTLISIVGIITYKSGKESLSWLGKASLFITLIRSLAALIGSWHSLHVYGKASIVYPTLSLVTSLSLLATWDSLVDSWGNFTGDNSWNGGRAVRRNRPEEYEMTPIGENRTENRVRIRSFKNWIKKITRFFDFTLTKKKFQIVRWMFVFLIFLSFLWQALALSFTTQAKGCNNSTENTFEISVGPVSICFDSDSLTNYTSTPYNYHYTTNCSEIPSTSNDTLSLCKTQESKFTCLLTSAKLLKLNIYLTTLSLFFGGFFLLIQLCAGGDLFFFSGLGRGVITFIAIFSTVYLIATASLQAQSLNTQGLEVCDINQELLSSKTGYIKEWTQEKLNTARHIALL